MNLKMCLVFKVAFLGKIGQRGNAHYVIDVLQKSHVNYSLVSHEKARTGFSVILEAKGVDRTILTFKGSNNDLAVRDINFNKLKTKWFYFSSMMEQSFETQKKIAEFAEKKGIRIAYNPSSYLTEKGAGFLKEILSRTELLILNDHEAKLLVGNGIIPVLLTKLCKLGPKNVIITRGKKGADCLYDNKHYTVIGQNIKVVEATGAGDSFASTFLGVMMKKDNPKLALQLATLNAQSVIQFVGAKVGLLSWPELRKQLHKYPPNLIVHT